MLGVPGIGTSVKEVGQAFEKYSPSYVNLYFLFKPHSHFDVHWFWAAELLWSYVQRVINLDGK